MKTPGIRENISFLNRIEVDATEIAADCVISCAREYFKKANLSFTFV